MKRLLLLAFSPGPLQSTYLHTLSKWGWITLPAENPGKAIEGAARAPQACIVDPTWPTHVLRSLLETLRARSPEMPIMFIGPWVRPDVKVLADELDAMVRTQLAEASPSDVHSTLSTSV